MLTRRPCAALRTAAACSPTSPTTAPSSAGAPPTSSTFRAHCAAWPPRPSCWPSPTTSTCRSAPRRGPRTWRPGGAVSCRSSWGWMRRTVRFCCTSAVSSLSSTCSPPALLQPQLSVLITPPAFYTKSDAPIVGFYCSLEFYEAFCFAGFLRRRDSECPGLLPSCLHHSADEPGSVPVSIFFPSSFTSTVKWKKQSLACLRSLNTSVLVWLLLTGTVPVQSHHSAASVQSKP